MLMAHLLPAGLLLLAVVILTLLLLRRSQQHCGRHSPLGQAVLRVPRPTQLETVSHFAESTNVALSAEAADELATGEVRLLDLEREISARLDTKMRALAHLIRESQSTIARLEALQSDLQAAQRR